MTAQDQLRALLRDDIALRLRAAGLIGTEGRFSIPSNDFYAQIGIQSSAASTESDYLRPKLPCWGPARPQTSKPRDAQSFFRAWASITMMPLGPRR
ncbi:hypothetical protein FHX48_001636 [Microbacterium halimionae]|uniref:Uncharacterized protein n=1 Tax=Microbacterium halimionae TaxID=1526413 RepID=A0A7W3JPD1_9MICO|nr:hypothetical protein [Microbacterium halimionae]NII95250.1 hypothetical protein [Microbacterium halimionae]